MKLLSGVAIYFLFWVMSAFLVLPFGVRTHDEAGAPKVPGQADSAPYDFKPWRIVRRVTIVATILFGIFLLNFYYAWVTPQSLDVFTPKELRGN